MLLSPSSRPPPPTSTSDFARTHYGNQFTMFLTAPVQAFCLLIGISGINDDRVLVVSVLVSYCSTLSMLLFISFISFV